MAGNLHNRIVYNHNCYNAASHKLAPQAFIAPCLWVGKNIFVPTRLIRKSTPWQQITMEIKTPEKLPKYCYFKAALWGKGSFNIDHIVIKEIK